MSYQLLYAPPGYDDSKRQWGQPHGEYETLVEAMAGAGHPDPAHWHTAVCVDDAVFVDWVHYFDPDKEYEDTEYLMPRWVIKAPGVSGEFTDLVTASVTR